MTLRRVVVYVSTGILPSVLGVVVKSGFILSEVTIFTM